MHDDLVDRTTDHTGRVDQHTYETVQKMAIKHAYLQDKHVERVPDLEEALLLAMELGLKVFIDCKSDAGATARLITKLFDQHPALYEMCAVCSFHPDIIYAVRKSNPRILTGLTYTRIFLEMEPVTAFDFFKVVVLALSDAVWGWAFHNWAWLFLGVNCVLLDVNSISRDEIKKWKARGIPAFVWTVNDLSTMRWLHSHGVSFMTDVPENFNVPDNGL
ncbi:hypothetical protein SARC_13467 [Sphaeroforma arctica JP610]|uniref:GP-PDE domain-containing protein n=1 Tax=Sphaeroforma arctica JP610 TaxID=667725 RepID=A0A0L0FB35_9EUKA|nr:hypothetical protein SARC_13467 [Sphaeroforma arctica JP610]KNC73975.1 hypothetical protein SARC_13467 [Sphaeroforma arctica JP610]|eukprot:XP_014147877.1 hypothetical protein SARC_13467 [Sphaeroforma arctica JP610]